MNGRAESEAFGEGVTGSAPTPKEGGMKVLGIVFVVLFWAYLVSAATLPLWMDRKKGGWRK